MNLLLASFFENYGLLIILVVVMALFFGYYYYRNKKYTQATQEFQSSLKKGDKVLTRSGFYGVVEKITETPHAVIVTLMLSENNFVDVDINAIYGIDPNSIPAETEQEEVKAEESPAENKEEVAEEPKTEEVAENQEK